MNSSSLYIIYVTHLGVSFLPVFSGVHCLTDSCRLQRRNTDTRSLSHSETIWSGFGRGSVFMFMPPPVPMEGKYSAGGGRYSS